MEDEKWQGPEVKECSVVDAFNMPLFELYLVIDTRTEAEVAAAGGKRLASARSIPPPPEGVTLETKMWEFFTELESEDMWPIQWKWVLVYGNDSENTYTWKVAEFLKKALLVGWGDPNNTRRNLFRMVQAVRVMSGGYPAFLSSYPMLCGEEVEDMRASPAEIVPGLFLSSRCMEFNSDTVRYWGLTHIIVDGSQDVPTLPGLVTLPVEIPDDNLVDFTRSFPAVYSFITEALANPSNRVLVLFWGRSRSAILVISWLIKRFSFTALQAFDYLQERVFKKLDKVYLALDQLHEWAEGTTGKTIE
eukprot:TRINITY_DN1270_c6_g4_i1.p1 TRINITY_DN1270_c6_g4~~TRINITY_DN1270_c6_g4_i1.p1  ORF type:complete len:323 (+),score=57.09 TRINITY_DN1270_c6_g4_i1:60-971(+)